MNADVEMLIERRRARRKLLFWRIVAVGLFAVLAVVGVRSLSVGHGSAHDMIGGTHVARLFVDGIITTDTDLEEQLADVRDDDDIKGLLVRINSPGGTATGGEAIFEALREVAEKKPVVAVMDEVATSAAYMAALAAERIYARRSSVTGSIGVIFQSADFSSLLDKVGIKPEIVRSVPLKARPNPAEPMTPDARRATEAVVRDMHALFVDMVARRRGLDAAQVRELADGRVFTGTQAARAGLVDALGGEHEALAWLRARPGVGADLPLRDLKKPSDPLDWTRFFRDSLEKALFSESLRLDGLVSLWHPDAR